MVNLFLSFYKLSYNKVTIYLAVAKDMMVMMCCTKTHTRNLQWYGAESNRRHQDFQSCALPTELPYLLLFIVCRLFSTAGQI